MRHFLISTLFAASFTSGCVHQQKAPPSTSDTVRLGARNVEGSPRLEVAIDAHSQRITAEEWRNQGGCRVGEPEQKSPTTKWDGEFLAVYQGPESPSRLVFFLWTEGKDTPDLIVSTGRKVDGGVEFIVPPNEHGWDIIRYTEDERDPGKGNMLFKVFTKAGPNCRWFYTARARCSSDIAGFHGIHHFVTPGHPHFCE